MLPSPMMASLSPTTVLAPPSTTIRPLKVARTADRLLLRGQRPTGRSGQELLIRSSTTSVPPTALMRKALSTPVRSAIKRLPAPSNVAETVGVCRRGSDQDDIVAIAAGVRDLQCLSADSKCAAFGFTGECSDDWVRRRVAVVLDDRELLTRRGSVSKIDRQGRAHKVHAAVDIEPHVLHIGGGTGDVDAQFAGQRQRADGRIDAAFGRLDGLWGGARAQRKGAAARIDTSAGDDDVCRR